MTLRKLSFSLLLLGITQCATATTVSRAPAPDASEAAQLEFVRDTLANGLTVIYHVDRNSPLVAVNTWYHVGSKHEQLGRTGLAHLFEHIMLFKGSRNVGDGERFALLERAGGRSGTDINGTTNFDRTNYFQQLPSNQLALALWLEADHMATAHEALTEVGLDNQREVVKNERRARYENQPYGLWAEKMVGHGFPTGHPYSHPVIGSMDDLSAATLDDVRDFFRRYYSPDNAVLVIAGDVDLSAARALVDRYFAGIPRGLPRSPPRSTVVSPVLGRGVRETVTDLNARVPAVYVGYRMPPEQAPGSAAVPLLRDILGAGRSSHLYSALVRDRQVATSAVALSLELVEGADLLVARALGRPNSMPDSLEAAVREAMAATWDAITPEQLSRVKARVRFGFINSMQTMGGFGGRADRLAQGQTYYGDPNWINRRLAELAAVTLDDVRELARTRLVPENSVTLVFVPAAEPAPGGGF